MNNVWPIEMEAKSKYNIIFMFYVCFIFQFYIAVLAALCRFWAFGDPCGENV